MTRRSKKMRLRSKGSAKIAWTSLKAWSTTESSNQSNYLKFRKTIRRLRRETLQMSLENHHYKMWLFLRMVLKRM